MFRTIFRWITGMTLLILAAIFLILILPRGITSLYALNRVYSADNAPSSRVAIIFGAGLRRDGTPTTVLRDRVETGVQLYFNGTVEKLLMSGDNQVIEYNEPESMKEYAISLGVPEDALVVDYAGRRTYDTCFRAKEIFKIDHALLVTQKFHLPRALYLCNSLGIEALGVEANNWNYLKRSLVFWNVREVFATATAFVDVVTGRATPILGEVEPIFED